MPKVISLFQSPNPLVNAIYIALTALTLSRVFPPSFGTLILFLATVFITSKFMPSIFSIQRIAMTAVLFIGLSPLYLIGRGFVTRSPLSEWDYQIYSISYLLIFATIRLFTNLKSGNSSNISSKADDFKNFIFGFFGLALVVLVEILLKQKSVGHAVAWIASGDSKNHLVNGVDIIRFGFLDITTFFTQPVSSPTYLALVLSQDQSQFNSNAELLSYQMQTYAYVWILLLGVLGLAFAATFEMIFQTLTKRVERTPKLPLLVSSIVPTFSFALGPALFDGFFTAMFGICAVILLTLWFFEISSKQSFSVALSLAGVALFATSVMSWMFVIPLTAAILIFGLRENLRKIGNLRKFIDPIAITLLLTTAMAIHFSAFGQDLIYKSKVALSASGAVSATNPNLYFAIIGTLYIVAILFENGNQRFSKTIFIFATLHILALFAFKQFSNLDLFSWNYYLIKYQWIMFVSLVPILISIAISKLYLSSEISSYQKRSSLTVSVITVFLISEAIVSTNQNWQKIWSGWQNPRSSTINTLLEQNIDRKNPTMFFHYGYAGDAMLANFWLNAFTDPVEPLKGWNYTIDTAGDVKQLCDVNAYYPAVNVVTSDSALESLLSQACPDEEFYVILKPSLF
jgi:hypothetical protein